MFIFLKRLLSRLKLSKKRSIKPAESCFDDYFFTDDMVRVVLSFLALRDIAHFGLVNKKMHEIVENMLIPVHRSSLIVLSSYQTLRKELNTYHVQKRQIDQKRQALRNLKRFSFIKSEILFFKNEHTAKIAILQTEIARLESNLKPSPEHQILRRIS